MHTLHKTETVSAMGRVHNVNSIQFTNIFILKTRNTFYGMCICPMLLHPIYPNRLTCMTLFYWQYNGELGIYNCAKSPNANRKPVGGFLSDLHCVRHCISTVFEIFDAKILWPRMDPMLLLLLFKVIVLSVAHMVGFLFDFHWPHRRICHRFRYLWRAVLMTLN